MPLVTMSYNLIEGYWDSIDSQAGIAERWFGHQ
jgi:hypothetical protein